MFKCEKCIPEFQVLKTAWSTFPNKDEAFQKRVDDFQILRLKMEAAILCAGTCVPGVLFEMERLEGQIE